MTKMTIDKINEMDSVEKCMTLAKNTEERGRPDLAEAAYYRAARLRAESDLKLGRRPDIDYHLIGLKNRSTLIIKEIGVEAEVYSHRTLYYKGSEIYITPLEEKLVDAGHSRKSVVGRWVVKETGELLSDLYEEKHPGAKDS